MSTVISKAWEDLRVAHEAVERLEREAAGQRYLNKKERKAEAIARKARRARALNMLADWKRRNAKTFHADFSQRSAHPQDQCIKEDHQFAASVSGFFNLPLADTPGFSGLRVRDRGFSIFRITQDFNLLTSPATAQFDGTSREEDLANVYQYDDLAFETEPGSNLKLHVTQALNISRFHGYQGSEVDKHGKAFRRAVFENPHVLGHHHYQRDGEHILSAVDLGALQAYTEGYDYKSEGKGEVDRFFVACSRRRDLDLSRKGHQNLWLRVNLGRSLPKEGSPGRKRAFIIEPFRLISCYSAAECEDIAYRWKVELELGEDEQPGRTFDAVLNRGPSGGDREKREARKLELELQWEHSMARLRAFGDVIKAEG